MEDLDKFLEGFLHASFTLIEYHEKDPKLPCLINIGNEVLPPSNQNKREIHDDSIDSVYEKPLIENIVEYPPHVISTEDIDDWE